MAIIRCTLKFTVTLSSLSDTEVLARERRNEEGDFTKIAPSASRVSALWIILITEQIAKSIKRNKNIRRPLAITICVSAVCVAGDTTACVPFTQMVDTDEIETEQKHQSCKLVTLG